MNVTELKRLLEQVQRGDESIDDALQRLRHLPFEDLGDTMVDHHRGLRQGFPEVIFGANKNIDQIERIISALLAKGNNVLATRLDEEKAHQLLKIF
ncbi:MAG TPA: 1-(5-phosphoribosyl)-5-amino-4-imidazole-carboxylate carboxylase, partial [Geobacteraceae bacterium]|nr:1-(5-phosphoribosyl)-5-amino-4-imidazole-carboxylate carboxylase [Geobacteraceae bacterium]